MSKRTKLLLSENNKLEKQIRAEDRAVLTDMVVYIRSADISPWYQERVRRDIWQMIIDGESRGMTAAEVIGEDYKSFCDSVIREIPKLSKKDKFLSLLRDSLLPVAVLMIIWFCFRIIDLFDHSGGWPYLVVTAGNVMSAILIVIAAFFIFALISKNSFHEGTLTNAKLFLVIFVIMLICTGVNSLVKSPVFKVHALIIAAGIIVIFAGYKILDAKVD